MDYVHIGAIGFAQLGQPYYFEKRITEKSVIREFVNRDKRFAIPQEFANICYFKIKRFPYEYESYDELVLFYDNNLVEQWELDFEEKADLILPEDGNLESFFEQSKHDRFYDFLDQAQSIDMETEELIELCKNDFLKRYPMLVVHKNNNRDEDNNLIAI